jgi:hypothetical protein
VIAATILATAGDHEQPAIVATMAWDRLIVDPLPGPRRAGDFTGLVAHGPDCLEVTSDSRAIPPAGSLLPMLASALPARIFLLDPTQGAIGIGRQLSAIAATVDASYLMLVDVGGDLVADGTEPNLRSPFADALILAGCLNSELPTTATICGPGLDGELDEGHVIARCRLLDGGEPASLSSAQMASYRPLFRWHPSEATGMLVASAMGRRGIVEMRDAGSLVPMTASSPTVLTIPSYSIDRANPYSPLLTPTRSLDQAEGIMYRARLEPTEIEYEREKAERATARNEPGDTLPSPEQIDAISEAARSRGVDFLTIRRLAELAGITNANMTNLVDLLATQDARRLDPPLWEVRPYPGEQTSRQKSSSRFRPSSLVRRMSRRSSDETR